MSCSSLRILKKQQIELRKLTINNQWDWLVDSGKIQHRRLASSCFQHRLLASSSDQSVGQAIGSIFLKGITIIFYCFLSTVMFFRFFKASRTIIESTSDGPVIPELLHLLYSGNQRILVSRSIWGSTTVGQYFKAEI